MNTATSNTSLITGNNPFIYINNVAQIKIAYRIKIQ